MLNLNNKLNKVKFTSGGGYFTNKNVKFTNLIGFLIILFFMVFNIVSVRAIYIYDNNISGGNYNFSLQNTAGNYGYLKSFDGVLVRICAESLGCEQVNNSGGNPKFYKGIKDVFYSFRKYGPGAFNIEVTNPTSYILSTGQVYNENIESRGYFPGFESVLYDGKVNIATKLKEYLTEFNYDKLKDILAAEMPTRYGNKIKDRKKRLKEFYKKGDFVLVEPVSSFRFREEFSNREIELIGTVNAVLARIAPGSQFNDGHVGYVDGCTDTIGSSGFCSIRWWVGTTVIRNMLALQTTDYNNPPSCYNGRTPNYNGGTSYRGCGFHKYNFDEIFNPKGKITIRKLDEDGNFISGAKFKLHKGATDGEVIGNEFTVNKDYYEITGLDYGTYYLEETEAPEGYTIINQYKFISVNAITSEPIVTVHNEKDSKGSITIYKKDSDLDIPLAGAKFELYKDVYCYGDPYDSCTTDSDGKCTFDKLDPDLYSLKEIEAPAGYELPDDECVRGIIYLTSKDNSDEITIYNKKKPVEFTINKIDDTTGNLITTIPQAEFGLYDSEYSCKNNINPTIYRTRNGTVKITVGDPNKTYYVKETSEPKGYIINDRCYAVPLGGTLDIPNEKICPHFFRLINPNSMYQRIWAYRKLKNDYSLDYRGMLVIDNDEDASCSTINPTITSQTQCLSGNYENKEFNANNLSLYNHTINFTEGSYQGTAYCRTSFNLVNKLNTTSWNVKSGQMPIQKLTYNDAIATTGTLEQSCYRYIIPSDEDLVPTTDLTSTTLIPSPVYINYVNKVNLDNAILDSKLAESKSGTGNFQTITTTADYYLNEVYAEIVTGKVSYDITKFKNYNPIGYGVVSKFNDKTTYYIPFSVTFGSSFPGLRNKVYVDDYACKVIPTQEIIITDDDPKKPDKLNLEFRIIDTSNPFPGKSGTTRKVGTNWRAKDLSSLNASTLNNKVSTGITSINDLMYDINKDGKLDDKDTKYFEWVQNKWKSNSYYIGKKALSLTNNYSFNSYIAYIMDTTNNSYNKNKTGPKYTIKLTPSDIKKIRDYNKNNKYDDFTLSCKSNAENCKMSDDFKKLITIEEH